MARQILGIFLAACLATSAGIARATTLTVFCAASLTDVMPALSTAYEKTGNDRLKFSFSASSTLARQIEAGASADIFIAADEEWMDYLAERQLLAMDTRAVVAGNRLVLIAARESALRPVTFNAELNLHAMLADGRLAVGDPANVPAGRYAQAALEHFKLWPVAKTRLAPAESVRVALMYVIRGEAPLGIVYSTDVHGVDGVKILAEIPAIAHPAIRYPAAALRDGSVASASAFISFLRSSAAQSIWHAYGFTDVVGEQDSPQRQ